MLVVFSVAVLVGETFEPLFRAEAVIRSAEVDEFLRVLRIDLLSLALNVRSVVTADVRTFVVDKPRLAKRTVNEFDRAFDVTVLVGVLYS